MSGFEGWWVNGETGKGMHVAEHWMEVRSDPENFGLTSKQVENILSSSKGKFSMGDTDEDGQRVQLLTAAMKNGWVRVRGYRAKYSIEMFGHCASRLPKVLKFLKGAGVHPNSEVLVNDLATKFSQRFMDGMSDIHRAIKQGKIPDSTPAEPSKGIKGLRTPLAPEYNNKTLRHQMCLNLGQRTHVPDPDPGDDKLEESKALRKGLAKLVG
jgi:hypothetical protein